jgi:hypothetical protein
MGSIHSTALRALLAAIVATAGQTTAEEPGFAPEQFTANLMVFNGPVTGTARMKIVIERFSTDAERAKLAEALRTGGTDALVDAMEPMSVGYAQIDQNLRCSLRVASTWQTPEGRMIRVSTNRPIHPVEVRETTRTLDYPIGVIEIKLPADAPGEGALLAATRVRFDEAGRLEVESLPQNTGPQRLSNVKRQAVKPKKQKKPKG